MPLPKLPPKAAYVLLDNPARRNALGLSVLRDLRSQLLRHLTSPRTGQLLVLPPFQPRLLSQLRARPAEYRWLLDASEWRRQREGLPNVLVLRSQGPVFCSGHDLKELAQAPPAEVEETFALCAEVMSLIRRSPAIVVCAVQGLATAAGFQLAMTADLSIAAADTQFRLPGMSIGLPCTSPATAVSRRLPPALAYRLYATAEPVTAAELQGAVDVVPAPEHATSGETAAAAAAAAAAAVGAFEARVETVVKRLATETAGQPQAFGKWAFWAQLGVVADAEDDFADAARWAGAAMALHVRAEDAREGIDAFSAKRRPRWNT